MNLMETFQVTSGTTAGREHRTAPVLRNNQDAVRLSSSPSLIVGCVSDGCGSQPYSEFGARQTVNTLTKLIRWHQITDLPFTDETFAKIYEDLALYLKNVAMIALDGDLDDVLSTHMLATAGGVIMTPSTTYFFGAGDFVFGVNGEIHIWKPESGNKPLYPAYKLNLPDDPRFVFRVHAVPTDDLKTFFFATDGGEDLVKVCSDDDEYIPGTDNPVGPLSQIWTTDAFYLGTTRSNIPSTGPEELTLWLNGLSRNVRLPGIGLHGGLLRDDIAIVIGRRV